MRTPDSRSARSWSSGSPQLPRPARLSGRSRRGAAGGAVGREARRAMIRTSSGASTDLLRARLARLGHVSLGARLVAHLAACGGAVALDLRAPLEQTPGADRARLDADAGHRRRLPDDQREGSHGASEPPATCRDDTPSERDERAFEGPRELGWRSTAKCNQFAWARSPSSALPDHASSSSQIGIPRCSEIPVRAEAEQPLLADELRRDVQPGGLAAQGHDDRARVVPAPRRSTRPSTLPPPQGSATSSERPKSDAACAGGYPRPTKSSGTSVRIMARHTLRGTLANDQGRPLGRPWQSSFALRGYASSCTNLPTSS